MHILNSSRQNQVAVTKEAFSKYLSTFFGVKFILLEAGPLTNILGYSFLTLNEKKNISFCFFNFLSVYFGFYANFRSATQFF